MMFNQRPQYTLTKQLPSISSQTSLHNVSDKRKPKPTQPTQPTMSTLSPYLTQIQRRKRVRSVVRDRSQRDHSNQRSHDLSTKKFRIQECSYFSNARNDTSQRRRRNQIATTTTNSNIVTISSTKNTIDRKRGFSRRKVTPEDLLVIERPSITILDKDLKDLYSKLRAKCASKPEKDKEKEKGFRRGKYAERGAEKSEDKADLRKIAYTVNNIGKQKKTNIDIDELRGCNKTVLHNTNNTANTANDRKNFRRNKYEVQSQILTNDELKEQTKYSSVDIQKKESNTSLIRQLDMQTQKEAEKHDKEINQKIKKILDKSLEKSTEQYFRQHHGHRKIQSRNQIQIYVSTVKNPSANRCSQASTLNISDKKQGIYVSSVKSSTNQDLMNYDFNLQQQVVTAKPQQKSPCFLLPEQQQDSGSVQVCQLSQFDKGKKQAERKFIDNNDQVRISWSEEDCIVKAELEY